MKVYLHPRKCKRGVLCAYRVPVRNMHKQTNNTYIWHFWN